MLNSELVDAVRSLIKNGTQYNVSEFANIYHDDLQIARRISNEEVRVVDKAQNLNFFKSKREEGAEPLSPEASFRYAHASGSVGHVVVERRMRLNEKEEHLLYNLVLSKVAGRWKVISEFVTPLN